MVERNVPAKRTAGPPTSAPPPSLTEFQRRLLADTFRLEGEAHVEWQPPSASDLMRAGLATPAGGVDKHRIERLAGELKRGLLAVQPAFAQWCIQKLFVLPTQGGSGLSAAIMADNFLDVAGHFADDIWQAATLEMLKTCTFRPSPAQFVAFAEPRHNERQRMLKRATALIVMTDADQPKPALKTIVPKIDQLRKLLREQLDDTTIPEDHRLFNSANTERSLALFESRPMEPWARDVLARMPSAQPVRADRSFHAGAAARAVLSTMAKPVESWQYGEPVYQTPVTREEPPPHTDIPEAMEME